LAQALRQPASLAGIRAFLIPEAHMHA